jgi:hypothetical protein
MIDARRNSQAEVARNVIARVSKREGVTMSQTKRQGAKVTADVINAMRAAKSDVEGRKLVATPGGSGRANEVFKVNDRFEGSLPSGPNAELVFTTAVRLGPGKSFTRDQIGAALPNVKCARWTVGRLAKAGAFTRS